jgi:D-psicose/D-tagatose/L-ribulose 3-epimerase
MLQLTYCVHPLAWTSRWSNASLDLIGRARELGFDMIEIPLLELDLVDPAAIRRRALDEGMQVCASTACDETHDPTSEDPAIRRQAREFLKRCIDMTAEMGGTVFTGVTYSAIGRRLNQMPDQRYWQWSAEVLKEAARHARPAGVTVGLEAINRYETFLVNTCNQALQLRELIDEPNIGIHLDAYHMNIEEDDFYSPTLKAAPYLCHYHMSESHRGVPGGGRVDWEQIYRALNDANYCGSVGMESFVEIVPAMQAASCMWRKMANSSDQLLSDGLKYLRKVHERVCPSTVTSAR